jgi:single-stranded-DNA-specific exonuclease
VPSLDIDGEISLDQVTPDLFEQLSLMEPYGMGNPRPVFVARAVRLVLPPRLLKEKHIKLRIQQTGLKGEAVRSSRSFDALGWGMAERIQQQSMVAGDQADIAFTIGMNHHPDFGGVQLSICDLITTQAAKGSCS